MRFKDKKQHKKNITPEFTVETDKYDNLVVTARYGDHVVTESHVSNLRMKLVQKSLARKLSLIVANEAVI